MNRIPKKIFVGGYTKSGTTFIGRAFGLFNGVYAKGEQDYFRLVAGGLNKLMRDYNENLAVVNKEVYDGHGSLELLTNTSVRILHDKVFKHIFFNGKPMPQDCETIVEKSPRNIFEIEKIRLIFPGATNVCVYREPGAVFRSLMRHMADHRAPAFNDPEAQKRKSMLEGFSKRWPTYIDIIEKYRGDLKLIQYQTAAADNQGFLDFAEAEILFHSPGLRAPVETLSKEYYLKSLPEEARAKSLVQVGPPKITLSETELQIIEDNCRPPRTDFDF